MRMTTPLCTQAAAARAAPSGHKSEKAHASHICDAVGSLTPPVGPCMGNMAQDFSVSSWLALLLSLDNVDKLQAGSAADGTRGCQDQKKIVKKTMRPHVSCD